MKLTGEQFEALAERQGWERTEGKRPTVCGSVRGYPFTAVYKGGVFGMVSVTLRTGTDIGKPVLREVRAALPAECSASRSKDALFLVCAGEDVEVGEHFLRSLGGAAEALLRNRVPVPGPTCGDPDRVWPATQPPSGEGAGEVPPWEENRRGNYFTGALGALLFGGVAVLPGALFTNLGTYYGMILFGLCPLAAFLGYHLFWGRRGRGAPAAVALALVPVLFFAEFAVIYLDVSSYTGSFPAPVEVLGFYLEILPTWNVLFELFCGGVCMALGWLVGWGLYRRK